MYVFAFLFAVVILLASVAGYFVRRRLTYWKRRGIYHDEPHWLMGNMQGFGKNRGLRDIMVQTWDTFKGTGPFCGFYFFQKPAAFVLDTQLAKSVLIKEFNKFANRGIFYNERDDPLTGHLFALDGVKWRQLRHKLSPTFTSGKMKFMFPTVVKVGEQFVEVLDELVKKDNIIEVKELLARFTTDVIGTCAFGIECNSLKDPNAEFRVMGRMAFQKNRHSDVMMGFIHAFPELARKLRMRTIHEDVHQFFMRIVRETVAQREQNNIKRNDFMDLLIELKNSEEGLTVEEVAAQAFIFFLAGFETSSTTIGFALYELAKNPEVQDKLRKEIDEVFEKHQQQFTYECMHDLHYLDQVIAETSRLYTVVPDLIREATEDYVVPGHPEFVIEKGVVVIIPSSAFHIDPELYDEPAEFMPERFAPELVAQRDPIAYLPFGDGPRNCIGLRFGKMQARIGLALLIKNFRFSVCQKTQKTMKFDPKGFVLTADGGIFLRADKI